MNTLRLRLAQRLFAALIAYLGAPHLAWSQAPVAVWTSRYDQFRTGANLREKLLHTGNVHPSTFGLLFSYPLIRNGQPGGDVYAQPLYVPSVPISGKGMRNVLFVATMNNMVFAFDADGPPAGSDGVLWSRTLGTPPVVSKIVAGEICISPCTNIRGAAGITSTPVMDLTRLLAFILERTTDRQWLHALDLRTGRDAPGSPTEIETGVFNTTPGGDTSFACGLAENNCAHGGIWQSGRAPAIDDNGRVILLVGNGKADRAAGGDNYGNSLVALDPATLAVRDWYTAGNHIVINAADLDLSGSGPISVPSRHRAPHR
jgi:hypothetical protein